MKNWRLRCKISCPGALYEPRSLLKWPLWVSRAAETVGSAGFGFLWLTHIRHCWPQGLALTRLSPSTATVQDILRALQRLPAHGSGSAWAQTIPKSFPDQTRSVPLPRPNDQTLCQVLGLPSPCWEMGEGKYLGYLRTGDFHMDPLLLLTAQSCFMGIDYGYCYWYYFYF